MSVQALETIHPPKPWRRHAVARYAGATLICAITTVLAAPLTRVFDPPNIVMLFLLAVVIIAVWLGRGPAMMSAFLSVALFDFFFVPPTFTFTVHDVQYVFTFAVMLVVALVIGYLASRLKEQAEDASAREARTAALYGMARELAGTTTSAQAAAVVQRFVAAAVQGGAVLFLKDADGRAHAVETPGMRPATAFDPPILELAMQNTECVELDFNSYLPLVASGRTHGVLAVAYDVAHAPFIPQNRDLLSAVAALTAIVAERICAQREAGVREILEI